MIAIYVVNDGRKLSIDGLILIVGRGFHWLKRGNSKDEAIWLKIIYI